MTAFYQKDYPRPQLVRKDWINLNGSWDFCFDDAEVGEAQKYAFSFPSDHQCIQVPFTYETSASGIGDQSHHHQIWYHRLFSVSLRKEKRQILHFEGVDYHTKVWINGQMAGEHSGGYARFSFDITDFLQEGENHLTVMVQDSCSTAVPRGKQRWKNENFGCWYVQTTGIWKTVWMEEVPEIYVRSVKLTPDIDEASIKIEAEISGKTENENLKATVYYQNQVIAESSIRLFEGRAAVVVPLNDPTTDGVGRRAHLWSPEHPDLYDLVLTVGEDQVASYFGMRLIETGSGQVFLNHRPLYQRLLLDQGYWADSHLTPPSEEALTEDIDKMMALGYNGARKHMKIEDERFLYWADVKGFLVWSEFPAPYEFCDEMIQAFTTQWMEAVKQNYSHPCIITWTPFNESWGVPDIRNNTMHQAFTQSIYYLTKSFDSMRPVITNDGWEHTISDILTLHDYEPDGQTFLERYEGHKEEILAGIYYGNLDRSAYAEGFTYHGQPVILSEFGGIAFNNGQTGWGYGDKVQDKAAFLERFRKITEAIQSISWICGYCYTQTTDVQQEINGLLNERREFKLDPEKIAQINLQK